MDISAMVSPTPDGGYKATSFDVSAEGATADEAVEALRARLQALLDSGTRFVPVRVSEPGENPWSRYAGIFAGDPWFDRWQAAIAENRRREDADLDSP